MQRYFEINENGNNIRCKLYFEKLTDIRRVIIHFHGFAGHKDNTTAEKFAERVLNKYKGIAVITFNLPGHGDDVKKHITLSDCDTYITSVIQYAKTHYAAEEIYAVATSFGGYLILKYLHEHGSPFRKIALRCPAVSMYDVLMGTIMHNEDAERLRKGKNVIVGFDRKIEVTPEFMNELEVNDIRKYDYIDYADDIILLHGTKDEVVPFGDALKFSEDNIIEFVPVENADHRFQNPGCKEFAVKTILDFFKL